MKQINKFYSLLQLARSMRRNFYMLDEAINETDPCVEISTC